jgi:8-oxo-dGTP pyrophosphatase MutT (NUDIX family)
MRESLAALALIENTSPENEPRWLVQWNAGWQRLALVGGHKRPAETYPECLRRETNEELGLVADCDFAAGDAPLARLNYVAWSQRAQEQTQYALEVYQVALLSAQALAQVTADTANCWVSAAEIERGVADDGRSISDQVQRVVRAVQNAPDGASAQKESV